MLEVEIATVSISMDLLLHHLKTLLAGVSLSVLGTGADEHHLGLPIHVIVHIHLVQMRMIRLVILMHHLKLIVL